MIANEVSEPVAGEFRQLYEEQKFGLRYATPWSTWPTASLCRRQILRDGGYVAARNRRNLAEILDNLSYVIRERFKILRQVRVHTAQGRLTMVLLMALPPTIVVLMLMLNPASFVRCLRTDRTRFDRRRITLQRWATSSFAEL